MGAIVVISVIVNVMDVIVFSKVREVGSIKLKDRLNIVIKIILY